MIFKRKRIVKSIIASFLVVVLLFNNISPALGAFQAVPLPKAPIDIRDRFDTDLFTGSASYSYDIKVPKGINELTPNVSLAYNSSSVHAHSMYSGMGWEFNRDYVERDANFTSGSTGDDKFTLRFQGAVHDLVYVSSEGRYHTKMESNLHITKLTSGEENDYNEFWQVITPDGTKYRFGQSTNSELVCNGRSYVHRWNLDLITDVHNNNIYYTYSENSGASYLTKIEYNTEKSRIIDFTYGTNPYQKQVYVQGCNITEASRLSNIQVKINTTLIRQYDLAYATAGNNQSQIQSITEKGSNGSSLPPTTFEYKPEIKTWATQSVKWFDHVDVDAPLNSANTGLVDVTGDGLPDIIKSEGNGNNTWKVWRNTGSSWSTTTETWINNVGVDAKLEHASVRLIDVTGDNLPEIVKADSSSSWKILRNTGSSWNTTWEQWGNVSSYSGARLDGTGNDSAVLVDINGDNLPDIVNSWWNAQREYRIFRNTGSGWSGSPEVWSYNGLGDGLDHQGVRVMDVNGDGLPDLVKTSNSGSNSTWRVYKNTGSSWNTSYETWINNAGVDAYFENDNVAVTDVNGDGLVDIVKSDDLGSADRWKVLLNQGNSWSTTWEIWIDPSSSVDVDVHNDNVRLVDANGDGLTDIVRGQMDCSCGYNTYYVWKNNGVSPDLFAKVITTHGGTISFDYKPSTIYDNTGADTISDLPFPLWVVEKMTVNNGMTNTHQTNDITTYSYKDGLYDYQDREFRGFAEVNTTEPNGSKKKYVFKQDDNLKGKLDEVQHRNSASDPFSETENTWSTTTSNNVTTVKLDTEKFYTYDATTSGAKIIQNDYTYDSYGNITKKSEKGDTSISTDDRFIYNEYTTNTTDWIVNTPKRTYLHKSDDTTKVSESWFYYDGNALWTSAPTKGDLTKEEKWLSGGTNTITQYTYDTYGNQTSVTDANNHTTTTAYDASTHTYPISITNAKNQTTTMSYDLGTGNLLSQTDPNGFITSYEYDAFGRITKEIKQYDSSSNPTTSYIYILNGVAPEGTLVSKRETSSSSATLDTYTFVDGFGRKIQTRSDAEDSTKQRVVDTFYDPIGEIKKETVSYLASSSAIAPTSAPSPTKFGDGSDGNITISSNTTETPIDSSVTAIAGGITATVGSGLGFSQGQIVLLHQTQGTNAGVWEYARVHSYSGTVLTLTSPLMNSYSSSGNNHAQVRVVPQYQNVTVNSGVTWTAKAWNGTTGGIMAFLADGTVTVSGTISANGKGFGGGTVTAFVDGHQGEGTAGAGGAISSVANGNGGGGNISPKGAGGGGNGIAGTTISGGGIGGSPYGTAELSSMVFGGGGGSGDDVSSGSGGNNYGGNGGGNMFINAASLSVTGNITVNGTNGGVANSGNHGGGGGGAGGSILLKSQTITVGSSLINAIGGSGGNGTGSGTAGGNGGNGRIRIEYETSLTGSTNPAASTLQTQIPLLPSSTPAYGTYVAPDASAKFTEWTYDPIGRISIVTNPKGDDKTISYDHWKETIIDENGHIKREFKNAFGKINKVEEVNGINTYTTTYEYDARDLLTKITDNSSNETTFAYDSLGRKTSQVDPDMGTWTYGYDGVGNITSQTDNRSVTITKTYDELDRLTLINYPTQTDTSFSYDIGKIGTLSIATDSAGTVNYSYDNRLRKTQEQRTINGTTKTTQFSYDAMDRLKSQTYPDGEIVNFSFNNQGEIESASGSASLLSNIDYNALGKITSKAFGNGLITNYTYNTDDFRLNRIQTGSLQDLGYTYDFVGNVKTRTNNLTSKTETFGYDDLDRLKTATESAGYNYAYEYNAIGNLTKFTNAGVDIDYTYGANGKPHALTSSTESATASAQQAPALLSDDWISGTISSSKWTNWGNPQTSVVNGELKITSTTSANYFGVEANTGYNLTNGYIINQLTNAGNQSLNSFEADVIYIDRDGTFVDAVLIYISQNKIWIQKKVNNVDTFYDKGSYNASTHKYFRIQESGGTMYFDWSTDGSSWTNFHSFANPFTITSVKIGMAAGTGASEGSTTYATYDNFTYSITPTTSLTDGWTSIDTAKWNDWGGAQTSIVSNQLKMDSTTGANYYGVDSVTNYNLVGSQITSQLINAGNQSLASWEVYPVYLEKFGDATNALFFYVSANKIWIQKKVNNLDTFYDKGSYNASTHKYFRIREASGTTYFDTSVDGTSWTNLHSFANPFDLTTIKPGVAVGTFQTEGSTTSATFDNFNILPSGMTYTYDANGNMTSDGTNCYQYNDANQLDKVTNCSTSQTIAEYVYDYNGNRMVKRNFTSGSLANTVTSWSDAFETKAIVGGATENTSYYFVNSQLIAKKNNSGTRTYFHNDHLGSTSVVTNQSGTLVEGTTYDPWGEIKSGGTASKFLYTGQEKDNETNLHYYNARYYDSHIRRFTQPDSIVQNIYDPQYLNRYSYVRNNPLKYTDPTGHVSILDWNKMLSNPTATNYNDVLRQFGNTAGNTAAQSFKTNGGGNYHPEKDKGVAKDVAKPVYNSLLGNDVKTLRNPNATWSQKSWATVGVIGSIYAPAKITKVPKVMEIVDFRKGLKTEDEIKDGIKAGEFQFSKYNPGRVDEYHGISLNGTSQGIFTSGEPYSHTVWKNGNIMFMRDQSGKIIIQTWK